MKWPLISRRRHEADVAAVNADRERIRAERTQFAKDRDAYRAAANTAARQFATADRSLVDHDARRAALAEAVGLSQSAPWSEVTTQVSALRTLLSRARSDFAALKAENTELRDKRPVDGGTAQPRTPAAELMQAWARANALQTRLDEVTAANQNCTCKDES